MLHIVASNACRNCAQPTTCCILHAITFQTLKHITQTHATSNSHNFVCTYLKQVKQSALEKPKRVYYIKNTYLKKNYQYNYEKCDQD